MRHPTNLNIVADIYTFGRFTLDDAAALKGARKTGVITGSFADYGAKMYRDYGAKTYRMDGIRKAMDEGQITLRSGELTLTKEGRERFKRLLAETPKTSRLHPEVRKAVADAY